MKKISFSTRDTPLRLCKSYSRIFNNKWFMFLLLVVFAAGCKKVIEQEGLVGVCPEVISSTPADNSLGRSINTTIQATFNEEMNPSTINTATFTVTKGTAPVSGTVSYAGTTATFTPSGNLEPNTVYTGTITTGAKDPAGNALVNNYVWNFTTGDAPDVTPPIVILTDPINNATLVALDKKN